MWRNGDFDAGAGLAGYTGLWLMAVTQIGIGLWASATTRHATAAFFLGLAVNTALLWCDRLAPALGPLASIPHFMATTERLEPFVRGAVETRHVAYFAALTILSLWMATTWIAAKARP